MKGLLSGVKNTIFTILLVIVFLILGLFISANIPTFSRLFDLAPRSANVASTRTIVSSLQPLGQLVTTRTEVAHADIFVSINAGIFNLCGHGANHVSHGVVEAGIDFTSIDESNVSFDETHDRYTLTLPPPIVTSCRLEYFRQYDQSYTACRVDWDTVRRIAEHESLTKFAEDMVAGGILDRAKLDATVQMSAFVNALTGSQVLIEHANADGEIALPPSCKPEIPDNWVQENGRWVERS